MFSESQPAQSRHYFSWDILRFILDGESPIDLPELAIYSREEASDFLRHYGYDLEIPEELQIVRDILGEAIGFIKTYFCPGISEFPIPLTLPQEFERINDIRDLLVIASGTSNKERQLWACAILRVMHTIHHINHVVRLEFFQEIKRQVLDNFKRNIVQDSKGNPVLGSGPCAVPLYQVFYKEEKERDSVILKLLQKARNVSEKIHDRLGVKLVTHTKLDALLVLRYLRQHNIIMFANVTPGRSRNKLINLAKYRRIFEEIAEDVTDMNEEEREREFIRLARLSEANDDDEDLDFSKAEKNPYSSTDYNSVQFTVQQLVKLENPGFFTARRLRVQLERYHLGPDLEGLLNELEGPSANREQRMLFPLEVQIIDYENYLKTTEGSASHAEYKRRQIAAAYTRVMGPLYWYLHPDSKPSVIKS